MKRTLPVTAGAESLAALSHECYAFEKASVTFWKSFFYKTPYTDGKQRFSGPQQESEMGGIAERKRYPYLWKRRVPLEYGVLSVTVKTQPYTNDTRRVLRSVRRTRARSGTAAAYAPRA